MYSEMNAIVVGRTILVPEAFSYNYEWRALALASRALCNV